MSFLYCFLITLLFINPQSDRNVSLQEEYRAARCKIQSVISENNIGTEIYGSEYMVYMTGGIGNMVIISSQDSDYKIYRYVDKDFSFSSVSKKYLPEIKSIFEFVHSQEEPLNYEYKDIVAEYNPLYFYLGVFNEENIPMLELNRDSMKAFKQTIKSREKRKSSPLTKAQTSCLLMLLLNNDVNGHPHSVKE